MKELIAEDLLKIKAVFFRPNEPFTWASGIKSPIYCDNRLTLTAPMVRNDVESALMAIIKQYYPQTELLMGTATAGIAHAAILAERLELPMGYVRGGAKDHGRKNRIEGALLPGQKTVVIEDLISTGSSAIEACEALREEGADVLGIASIFTYGLKVGKDNLEAAKIINHSATDFDTISKKALELGYIDNAGYNKLMAFIAEPENEAWTKQE